MGSEAKILEFLDAAAERTESFKAFAYLGDVQDDARDMALAAIINYQAAQTLILAEMGRTLAVALGSGYDLGNLLEQIKNNTEAMEIRLRK